MKSLLRFSLLVSLGSFLILLETCMLPSVSINDRITLFLSDLNTVDRSNINQNLDPAIVAPSQSQWNNTFFATGYEPYSISPNPPTIFSSSDVETNITGTGGAGGWGPYPYKFVMVNVGTGSDDWRIHSLYVDIGSGWTIVF